MKKALWLVPIFVIAGGFYFFSVDRPGEQAPGEVPAVPAAEGEYANLASNLAKNISEISPTESIDEIGWIAHRVSFAKDKPYAYIEYTDTKVALKLLLQYYYKDAGTKARVLATFVPDEFGGWDLNHGKDAAAGTALSNYIYKGDTDEWVPEIK